VDAVVAVVDPSYDAVMLMGKIRAMAGEGGKRLHVVLNRIDEDSESFIRSELEQQNIGIAGSLPYSREITRANLRALPLRVDPFRENLQALLKAIESQQ
jgi:CO dehydrogenase maturation factor